MPFNRLSGLLFLSILACDSSAKRGSNVVADPGAEFSSAPRAMAKTNLLSGASAKNFEGVAAQACKMAGGTCLPGDALAPGNVLVAGINCRPLDPGIFCVRRSGPCEGHDEQRCCEKDAFSGKSVVHGRVGCDRGYPVCLNVGDWRASSAATCTTPLPATVPADAPNLWAGAVDVQSAARWACEQVGGRQIERKAYAEAVTRGRYDTLCDAYAVNFADFGPCCIPKSACPENPAVECCSSDGEVSPKFCHDGKAGCSQVALEFGMVREGPPGSCRPF